ncbi:MAG: N-acetyltransferase [Gammaproteobacteria bacterium HGW-Gammaproteobacteria-5]|nr:MAG: N-acetyltransferase [Gammaproteobacteria bacterium HGW-Gammaproteobacteria-5]
MYTPKISLRPIASEDLPFLNELYASTRIEELASLPWDKAAKDAFLDQQFNAQHSYYQAHFPQAEFQLIELAGSPIGRAYLLWDEAHLQIIDVALLPAQRGQGIGSRLLRDWLSCADAQELSAGLYVESYNPAQTLYRRNGFIVTGENGVYLKMLRPCHQANSSSPRNAPCI